MNKYLQMDIETTNSKFQRAADSLGKMFVMSQEENNRDAEWLTALVGVVENATTSAYVLARDGNVDKGYAIDKLDNAIRTLKSIKEYFERKKDERGGC